MENQQKAKVSVITTNFNGSRFLKNYMTRVANQIFHDFEIIFVDDGSNDDSLKMVRAWELANYVRIVESPHQGVGKAKQLGLKYATGDYVMFVDVDDEIEENHILNYLKVVEEGAAEMAFVPLYVKTKDKIYVQQFDEATLDSEVVLNCLAHGKLMGWLPQTIAKRSLWSSTFFSLELEYAEDSIALLRLLSWSHFKVRLAGNTRPTYRYILNPTSLTQAEDSKTLLSMLNSANALLHFNERNETQEAKIPAFFIKQILLFGFSRALDAKNEEYIRKFRMVLLREAKFIDLTSLQNIRVKLYLYGLKKRVKMLLRIN